MKDEKVDRTLDYVLSYCSGPNALDPSSVMMGQIQVRLPAADEAPAADGGKKN